MSYDLRLTVPTEEEIKGLSIEQILALFSFDKADQSLGEPPKLILGGASVKSILYWEVTGSNLARPINTTGTLSAGAQYTGLGTLKQILYEGSLGDSRFTFARSGLYLAISGIMMTVTSATTIGDIIMGKSHSEKVGMPVVLRDVSSWGASGVQFQTFLAGPGDTLGWYSQWTTAGAATIAGYYMSMMILRLGDVV